MKVYLKQKEISLWILQRVKIKSNYESQGLVYNKK